MSSQMCFAKILSVKDNTITIKVVLVQEEGRYDYASKNPFSKISKNHPQSIVEIHVANEKYLQHLKEGMACDF